MRKVIAGLKKLNDAFIKHDGGTFVEMADHHENQLYFASEKYTILQLKVQNLASFILS